MRGGSTKWAIDGSFDHRHTPTVSSAGWIAYSTRAKSHLCGAFYEVSPDASACRGELLGLTALHLITFAMKLPYNINTLIGSMHCDNEHVLIKASLFCHRIPPDSKHGDLLWLLRNQTHHAQ